MLKLINKDAGPIGLDIAHDSIRMIQLGHSGGKVRVIAAAEMPVRPEVADDPEIRREFIIAALKTMRNKAPFYGRNVVSCLPGDSLKIKSFRLDTVTDDEIAQVLDQDVAPRLGVDPETDEIRYIVAGNVYQGEDIRNEVIFFGAGRDDITGHLEMLEEAQLSPVAIDSVPCALFRSFRGSLRRQEDQETVSVFIDVGDEVTTVIIGRGQQIAFIKQIPIASNQLNAKVASILGVTTDQAVLLRSKLRNSGSETGDAATTQEIVDATGGVIEELAREVSLCFRYYAVTFRGQRPSQAVFAGVEAQEPALLDALKRHMGIEIKIAQPLRGFDLTRADFSSEEQSALCQWAVAVGLSIKGWDIPEEGGDSYERN